ncbi:uncharacterized protein LOC111296107 isoform X3 [Durio zibethinus]|uniref:Uncharacterized protein LOC111296107 isoform X3 n=1 Tax=Durio zibethinus TaxID=66656 RepID=A0A6P5YZD1_DURZI|nr:uncharacterized protein LOC111296107 isoform X3 [Durio zibethinus]
MSNQTLNDMSSSTIRSLSEISESDTIHLGVDLVSAARRSIGFLRSVNECQWLHQRATIAEAIRRYDKVWMPLISDLTVEGSTPPMVLPPFDVEWVWFCHTLNPSYPTVYVEDLKDMLDNVGKVVGLWETVKEKEVEETKKLWERTFDQPYEKAGGIAVAKPRIYWEVSDVDVNTKYKSMIPRFLLGVCVFVRTNAWMKATNGDTKHNFLRLRMVRCHRELKLDKSIPNVSYDTWWKAWHLYCEFGTRGLMVELRGRGGHCFKGSKLLNSIAFYWNDLLRAPSITLTRESDQVRIVASITPPVQAPYLLKCVPDRVTDDSGAMISDVILKLNNYRPQKGRWLSRTVLDHAAHLCIYLIQNFGLLCGRVGGGIWRRGSETPSAVNWEDRIIEIREGSWSYVAGSIGKAPEKVVGTATPNESPEPRQAVWHFSTGDELLINWGSSTSSSGLSFCLRSQEPSDSSVMLLRGRKMQYQEETAKSMAECKDKATRSKLAEDEKEVDDGFVTLVRFTEENPTGRATALLNWKLLVVELLPEEDAILVLLLCVSILRTVSEISKEDVGSLLVRRRLKEAKLGARDWGSVVLHPSSLSSPSTSPYLQPWYWNANKVMAQHEDDSITRQTASKHSPVEGGDMLYKRGIIA